MDYTIREMRKEEYPQLKDFLYEAVYVPEGTAPPDRAIIDSPELQVYIRGFGTSRHDHALAAVVDGDIAGVVWARIMDDYGHINDETPSLAISVHNGYRNSGIGTALLKEMHDKRPKKEMIPYVKENNHYFSSYSDPDSYSRLCCLELSLLFPWYKQRPGPGKRE